MKSWLSAIAGLAACLFATPASAFCGFYVAQANAQLFNNASKVVLARNGDQTVITMASDYQGSPSNFAMVVPVPTVIKRNQVRVSDAALLTKIDNYSAPRLVEYHDPDPCAPPYPEMMAADAAAGEVIVTSARRQSANALGVKIEARYQVGEYDILILSAKQSNGLVTWLTQNGYKMPPGAEPVVGSYLRQNMKFFVAKVNLKRRAPGAENLRPLQISYASRKFMLPIRLGTVNARGPQELFVFTLTPNGRVETTNYRTVKLKSDLNIPTYVKGQFGAFYRAMFARQVTEQRMRSVFLEYAWDSGSCDPCSGDPLDNSEERALGATWNDEQSVFITRLHLRYTRQTFPEDLMLQETSDRENFQGRYIMRHPFKGEASCPAARAYRSELVTRWDEEARTLARATGWPLARIKADMRKDGARPTASLDLEKNWLLAFWENVSSKWSTLFA